MALLGAGLTAILLVAADEPPRPPPPPLPPELKLVLSGQPVWKNLPPEVRQQAIEQFRAHLPEFRQKVQRALYQQIKDKRAAAWEPINHLVLGLACAGPLLLVLPIFLARHYPGKLGMLFRYSALSAVLFSLTVLLFSIPLAILSEVWEELVVDTDPRLRSVDAAFNLMDQNAEEFLSRDLPLTGTFQQAEDGNVESFVTLLLANLAEVRQQLEVFAPLVALYRKLDWVFGSLPKIQCLIFAVLFVWPLYPVFKAIVLLPAHAAAGEPREGRRVAKLALRNWWQEILAILCLIVLFVVLLIINDIVLNIVAEPATSALISSVFITLDYLGHEARPALAPVYFSMAATALFYLFNMVAMTVGLLLYIQCAHGIFRARFHDKVPLRHQRRFWRWGTLAVLWVQTLPVLFIYLAGPAIQAVFNAYADADPPNYLGGLVAGSALLFFGILLVFWLARGFKALAFLWRYRIASGPLPGSVANPVANR